MQANSIKNNAIPSIEHQLINGNGANHSQIPIRNRPNISIIPEFIIEANFQRLMSDALSVEAANTETQIDFLCKTGKKAVQMEIEAITGLLTQFNDNYAKVCTCLLSCQGRVILTGMGKSGHIARKIAATLSSTGTPSYFVHPGEASHGDSGVVTRGDIVIAISYSGETEEILTLLPIIKLVNLPMIAMTGNPVSTLAQHAAFHLNVHVNKEACPLGLAPTSSTTNTLVMGDAIAITLLAAKGFKETDFARFHPGGALGRRLLLQIDQLMHTNDRLP